MSSPPGTGGPGSGGDDSSGRRDCLLGARRVNDVAGRLKGSGRDGVEGMNSPTLLGEWNVGVWGACIK